MQSQLFRKNSIDRISSPEQLQDYMRVTSPGIWMVLGAVIALLAGLIISSAMATLESTIPLKGEVYEDGEFISMELDISQKDLIEPGMDVRVADKNAQVSYVYVSKDSLFVVADLNEGERLPAGVYDVEIVTQTISPISFLLN